MFSSLYIVSLLMIHTHTHTWFSYILVVRNVFDTMMYEWDALYEQEIQLWKIEKNFFSFWKKFFVPSMSNRRKTPHALVRFKSYRHVWQKEESAVMRARKIGRPVGAARASSGHNNNFYKPACNQGCALHMFRPWAPPTHGTYDPPRRRRRGGRGT